MPQASPNHSLSDRLAELARSYSVETVYVFGSRSREIAARLQGVTPASDSAHSDVDIGADPRPGVKLAAKRRAELAIKLEDLFEVDRVDLVILPEAGAFLALDVIRGEILYCEDPLRQAEQELYVLRRAADLEPFERERRRMTMGESS